MKTALLIPTFQRSARLPALVERIAAATTAPHQVYFILEKDDEASIAVADDLDVRVILNPGPPTYASCINAACEQTDEPFFFLGADDLDFERGWLERALAAMEEDDAVSVVGVRDPEHDRPDHATHYLVDRTYIETRGGCLDPACPVLYTYHHNWTDWEFILTAKIRGVYRYCETAIVHHLHPGWASNGSIRTDSERYDATYAKANRHAHEDWVTFLRRAPLWMPELEKRRTRSEADWYLMGLVDLGTRQLEQPPEPPASPAGPAGETTYQDEAFSLIGQSILDGEFSEKWRRKLAAKGGAAEALSMLREYDARVRRAISLTLKSNKQKENQLRRELSELRDQVNLLKGTLEIESAVRDRKLRHLLSELEESNPDPS